jgi:lipopolysaccharide transport system permease protein
MLWREIKGRYSQTFLGLGWALIQPFIIMIAFTLVFSRFAKVSSEGVPYPIFAYAALAPWTFFSSAIAAGTFSIAAYRSLVTRVYFPRIILPVAEVATRLVDFFVAASLLGVLMALYGIAPTGWILFVPALLAIQLILAIGVTLWTSALYAFYRDIGPVVQLGLQVWLLLSPVAYSLSAVPDRHRWLYLLNPMAGVIDGYRSVIVFGRGPDSYALGMALAVTAVVFLGGYVFFRQLDQYFADVI